MTKSLLAALAVLGLLATGCSRVERDIQTVRRALDRTEGGPHAFRFIEKAEKRTIEVSVEVEDSFRSRTMLAMDGVPLLEQVVVDDALALRLLAPDRWNPAAGTPLEPILGSGRWVVDPAGAPAVFQPSGEQQSILGDVGMDQLFDVQNAIEYTRQAVDGAVGVQKFNADSLEYKPSEDPFRGFNKSDEKRKIERYVAIPPSLPRTEEQLRRLPGPRFFRKLSVYAKDGRAVRVLELIDFESHEDLVRAKERGEPRFLLSALRALRRGEGEEPIRPRSWSLEILSRGRPAQIALPSDAVTANLQELTGSHRLSQLPDRGALRAAEQPAQPA